MMAHLLAQRPRRASSSSPTRIAAPPTERPVPIRSASGSSSALPSSPSWSTDATEIGAARPLFAGAVAPAMLALAVAFAPAAAAAAGRGS